MSLSRRAVAVVAGASLISGGLAATATAPALGNPAGNDLVISEVYGGGGNSGATYTHDFVELHNPTTQPLPAAGLTISYYSSSGSLQGQHTLDAGTVPAGGRFLVQEAAGTGGTTPLPDPDATGSLGLSGSNGSIEVTRGTTVVDLVGYGTAARREGTATPALTNTTSAARDVNRAQPDTDDNRTDFTVGTPTPEGSGSGEEEPPPSTEVEIAEVQGEGATSPLAGQRVTTRGVVTAAYPTGGFFDFVIQTPGTGAGDDTTPGASDAVWVSQASGGLDAEVGDYVEVTGVVAEQFGRTELSYDPGTPLVVLDEPTVEVTALATTWWPTAAAREAHEGELLDLSGQPFTVTNNYATNQFGEVGLATGTRPLVTPTEVANPTLDPSGYQSAVEENFARGVVLDDGSSWNYVSNQTAQDTPLPWIDRETTARVGAAAQLLGPVVLDYGFNKWRLQPTSQVTGVQPGLVTFEDTRADNAEPRDVGGDLTIATFNVLNYFNTTGTDWVESGRGTCTYYTDRDSDPVTDNRCEPGGPRGAAEAEDLDRQQAKIVEAINTLDASVVSLEEIENSVALGEERDDALAQLTSALNASAGEQRWAFVPSPPAEELPALENQDVIRTAFIYDPEMVETVGSARVLDDPVAFANARQPLAQAFVPVGREDVRADGFAVVVNHFKSKGSACAGEPNGPQGNCNESRVRQARALAEFADDFAGDRGLDQVFLTGDFNSYSEEDPMIVLERAGFAALDSDTPDEWSYSFDGQSGSLDHVLANDAALAEVTGVDIWEINANEALAHEYSRFNYNVTDFYAPDVFRASDHNPEVVGLDVRDASEVVLVLSPATIKQKKETSTATVSVTGVDDEATGVVRFLVDGEQIGRRSLLDGTANFQVGPFVSGTYEVSVEYLGDDDNLPASDTTTLVVGNGRG